MGHNSFGTIETTHYCKCECDKLLKSTLRLTVILLLKRVRKSCYVIVLIYTI